MKSFKQHLVEKTELFKYYYHVTLKSNVGKIKSKGIIPFQPSNYDDIVSQLAA
jgi:hypothetical protein